MAKGAKTGGRRKGTPNKTTAELKGAILAAFSSVGGAEYLERIAREQPAVFCTLLGKVLPLTVGGDETQPFRHVFAWQQTAEPSK
jgi:hypothetical protein